MTSAAAPLAGPTLLARWWQAVLTDPYRLLFPIGLLNLIIGLGLWLPLVLVDGARQPIYEHMQILLHGCIGAFIVGFLLTFLPRFLQTAAAGPALLVVEALAFLLLPVALLTGVFALGHVAVLVAMGGVLVFLTRRLTAVRAKCPPPLLLVYLAVVGSALAAGWQLVGGLTALQVPLVDSLVAGWQKQGLILLVILGISPVLVQRLRGGQCCGTDAQQGPPRAQYVVALVLGGLFLASYLPLAGWERVQAGVRAAIAVLLLGRALPLWRLPRRLPWFMRGVWTSYWSIVLGLGLPALWPGHAMAWAHLLFITGFLLLTLLIAARVVAAHGGELERIQRDRWGIGLVIACLWIAVLSRIGIDWAPQSRELHLWLAAVFALVGLAVWLWRYGLLLLRPPRPA